MKLQGILLKEWSVLSLKVFDSYRKHYGGRVKKIPKIVKPKQDCLVVYAGLSSISPGESPIALVLVKFFGSPKTKN
jgi:hypothetical protein